jgi:hypothetical protein
MKDINKFINIASCVDPLELDLFLHEGRYKPGETIKKNLDNLLDFIKSRHVSKKSTQS